MRLLPRRRPTIEQLKEAGDVAGLRATLDSPDPRSRAEAAAALAAFEGPEVEDGLARALADPDQAVRVAALEGMEPRTGPIAVWPLLRAVAEWPYETEYGAIEKAFSILVRWAPERGAEALARGLSHPGAARLDRRHRDALLALVAADPRGQEQAQSMVADELVKQLSEADEAQSDRAEEMLTWLGPAASDSVLRGLDSDGDGAALIRVAGVLRDARAVEPLVARLGAPDPEVRGEAATALGFLNDTRSVQALIGATQDPDQDVRDAASEALNTMGVAAVIIGVASAMRETVREQLAAAGEAMDGSDELPTAAVENSLPAAEDVPPLSARENAPTWTQEVLARLLKRAGGQP